MGDILEGGICVNYMEMLYMYIEEIMKALCELGLDINFYNHLNRACILQLNRLDA